MRPAHAAEALLASALVAWARRGRWPAVLRSGERLGAFVGALGLRRRVAEQNLLLAFPERSAAERAAILAEHYRELGRVAIEYPRTAELARAPRGEVVAAIDGEEHLEAMRGRGALLLSGHFGNFELLASVLNRMNPVDYVVKPLSNPKVEAMLASARRESGVGMIPMGQGIRGVLRSLRAGRWVALLADQDARRHGVFVPFFGRLASTPEGPARLSLMSGAPIVFGTTVRLADGRHRLRVEPPKVPAGPADEPAIRALTAWHTTLLEQRIRESPTGWFWLHRRWKTPPPMAGA